MSTILSVATVTPRVKAIREKRGKVRFPEFYKALERVYSKDLAYFHSMHRSYWLKQHLMYNNGIRDNRLAPETTIAMNICYRPMGH